MPDCNAKHHFRPNREYLCDGSLRLRAVEPSDAEGMWIVEADSSQWVQNSMAAPFSKANIAEYASGYDANPFSAGQLRLIIEECASGCIVGIADLYEISPQHRNAMVGIYICPTVRQRGYATASIGLLEDYARDLLNLRVLGARITQGNEMSDRLFRKCGYQLAGTLAGWLQSGPETLDMHLYCKSLT